MLRSSVARISGYFASDPFGLGVDVKHLFYQQHRQDYPNNAKRIGHGIGHSENVGTIRSLIFGALKHCLRGGQTWCVGGRAREDSSERGYGESKEAAKTGGNKPA